jgi:hypothetical protein
MKRRRPLRPSFMIITAGATVAISAACTAGQATSPNPTLNPGVEGGSPASSCPAQTPNFGDPCVGSVTCTYDGGVTPVCGDPISSQAACIDGTWSISGTNSSCNPGVPEMVDAGTDASLDASSGDDADAGG